MECPCCGGRLTTLAAAVRAAAAEAGGIPGQAVRVLHAAGGPVPTDVLIDAVYLGARRPPQVRNCLYVAICRARPVLRRYGLEIVHEKHGVCADGYVLRAVAARVAA